MIEKYTGTTLVSNNEPEEIRKASLDLLNKLNKNAEQTNSDIGALNIPTIVTDTTYGTYRQYPDGTTQGKTQTFSRLRSAAIALTTATTANIFSFPLPRGKWRISSAFSTVLGATTTIGTFRAAISKQNATLPATDTIAVPTNGEVTLQFALGGLAPAGDVGFPLPDIDYDNPTDTTLYFVARCDFGVSTLSGYGSVMIESII